MTDPMLSEEPCRHAEDVGPLFSDEQLEIWHRLAAKGSTLMFNGATMESILDEVRRLRADLEASERRVAELVEAGDAMAAPLRMLRYGDERISVREANRLATEALDAWGDIRAAINRAAGGEG